MKKIIAVSLMLAIALSLCACGGSSGKGSAEDPTKKSDGVMTYGEYAAADIDKEVVIETYVQAKRSWYNDTATLYTQDGDGAYFIYNAVCSEADYAKLVEGQKIKVTGYKAEWAGEIEIAEGATIEIEEGNWIATPIDLTASLGDEEALKSHMNQKVSFKGLTVSAAPMYNWDGSGAQGDDIYFVVSNGSAEATFVMQRYLTASDSAPYQAAEALTAGQVIDVEGYLYWYEGVQPHITSITVVG
jgi:DNA/RNA endonuclease YhcR with UshA esterase domain